MMLDQYSIKYKIAEYCARLFFGKSLNKWFFSADIRSSIVVKIVFKLNGKVLMARKIQRESLSKICLPYGFVDLNNFDDNITTCIKVAYDKMNLDLDEVDFAQSNLIDVKMDYENDIPKLIYVYDYNLTEEEFNNISDSYRLYDFFLLDLDKISEYKKKKRFVNNSDYFILNNLK